MTILESFKKLATAWGIEPKGDNIADAVNNIVDNAPFGVKTKMVEVVPEQSVTVNEWCNNGEDVMAFPAKHNTKYTVEFDGVKTECISWGDSNTVYIGNGNLPDLDETIGKGENVPFCIECRYEEEWCVFYASANSTHTLAIYEEQEVVKQLDPKFVGASGGGVVFRTIDGGYNYTCDMPYDDVYAIFTKDKASLNNAILCDEYEHEYGAGVALSHIKEYNYDKESGRFEFIFYMLEQNITTRLRFYSDGRVEQNNGLS